MKLKTIYALAALLSGTVIGGAQAHLTCDEGLEVAGYMCITDKPKEGCDLKKSFPHDRLNPSLCFSCKPGTVWDEKDFACKLK